MPRSRSGSFFALALMPALAAWAADDSAEVAGGTSYCQACVESNYTADVNGQDHVDFRDRGDGHIDFRDSGSDSYVGHITFRVDPAGGYAINVEFRGSGEVLLHAGEAGGAVRVVLHEDGRVEAGGEKLAACDPALGARITVAWSAGAAVVAVVDADGVLRSTQHALDFAPDTVSIVADEVCALSVARQ